MCSESALLSAPGVNLFGRRHVKGIVAILAAGTTAGLQSDWEEVAMSIHASVAGASECEGRDLKSSGLIMSSTQ